MVFDGFISLYFCNQSPAILVPDAPFIYVEGFFFSFFFSSEKLHFLKLIIMIERDEG